MLFSFLILLSGVRLIGFLQETSQNWQMAQRAQERRQQAERVGYVIEQQQKQLGSLKDQAEQLQAQGLQLNDQVAFSNYLERVCKEANVQIISLPLSQIEQIDGYKLSEERFSLKGSLSALLKVMYRLENKDRIGTLTYSRFEKKTIRRKGKEEHLLLVDLVLKRLGGGER